MYFSAIPNFCAMALPPGNFCFASVMCLILSTLCKVSNTYQAKICCRLLIPRRLGLLIAAEIGVSDWYQTNAQESSQNMLYIYIWVMVMGYGHPSHAMGILTYLCIYIYNIFRCIYIYIYFNGLTMPWHISHPTAPQLMASAKAREWSSTKALARRCLTGRMCSTGTAR